MEKVLKHSLPRLNVRWGNLIEVLYAVLIPFSLLWAAFVSLRRKYFPQNKIYRSSLPVISLGNIHSGGSGKTPLVRAVCEHYRDYFPSVVSRGYKASLTGKGARVNLQGAYAVGDEAWMLHKLFGLMVWIGKDRVQNIKKIENIQSSKVIVLDDGFQHLKIKRDIDLVVIDTNRSPEETFCLPLGNLREPFSALKSASAIVLTGSNAERFLLWREKIREDFPDLLVFDAKLKIDGLYYADTPYSELRMKKLVAFSGIANNSRFENTLKYLPHVTYYKGFSDHHAYTQDEVNQIIGFGKELEAEAFVTTDKDWVKVNRMFRENDEIVVSLRIGYELPEGFWGFLDTLWEKKC